MLLWNIIRDFFVQYVFGGCLSNQGGYVESMFLGDTYVFQSSDVEVAGGPITTLGLYLPFNNFQDDFNVGIVENSVLYMSMGDWLSTTATIIVLVGLFIGITLLIISLFKWIVRVVSLRG